jgi:rhodanese-related sulfurtransferase
MKNIFSEKGIITDNIRHLSAREAFEALQQGAILVDIREDFLTHMRTFAVEPYIVCPFSSFDENISLLPKDKPLIIADATGLQSKKAVEILTQHGFTMLANLAGGIMDWDRDGFPVNKNPAAELSGQCPCMLKPMNRNKKTPNQ